MIFIEIEVSFSHQTLFPDLYRISTYTGIIFNFIFFDNIFDTLHTPERCFKRVNQIEKELQQSWRKLEIDR